RFCAFVCNRNPEAQSGAPDQQGGSEAVFCWKRRRRRCYPPGGHGVLGGCARGTNEKLRIRRDGGRTAVRSCRPVYSCERRSEWIIARPRKNSPAVLGIAWCHCYW